MAFSIFVFAAVLAGAPGGSSLHGGVPVSHVPAAARTSPKEASPRAQLDPWRRLRPQMTKDDVLGILGAPPWTDRTLVFEFWMYEVPSQLASGVVVFEKERVVSWRRPSSGTR